LKHFDGIGIDNGMFGEKAKEEYEADPVKWWNRFEKMIKVAICQEKREILARFQFFVIPDEPMNWEKTMKKYEDNKEIVQRLRNYGAPAAICIQNGANVKNVPFNEIDVIFIGGDDKYKTGPEAKAIVDEAKSKGIQIHMGRVNGIARMNTAASWGVDTADGTYLMHELGKSIHEIERSNPIRPRESIKDYSERVKRILHGTHKWHEVEKGFKPHTENDIITKFIQFDVDNQNPSRIQKRYDAIYDIVKQYRGRPVNKYDLHAMDNYLPVAFIDPTDEVVEFDQDGNVKLDAQGKPVKNMKVFSDIEGPDGKPPKKPWRNLPPGIPFDPKNHKIYKKYMDQHIAKWRDRGVMPK
jgi:hypothetical protein